MSGEYNIIQRTSETQGRVGRYTGSNSHNFIIGDLGTLVLAPGAQFQLISQPSEYQLQEDRERHVTQFKEQVNERSRNLTVTNIAGGFGGYIQEPKVEVEPVLAQTDFYKGETVLEEKNYTASNEHRRKISKKKGREAEIGLKDVHRHGRYIILVGGAGSGKTTLIKRYAKLVLEKKIEKLEDVTIVHFVNIRDLSGDKLSPRDLLFGKMLPGEQYKKAVQYGYEWMQDQSNQDTILLALDGIDTAPWMLSAKQHELISYDDPAKPEVIMYNILRGHLFPKCWLLLTSREYGITKFRQNIRPNNVIALKGLSEQSIEILVQELGKDYGNFIWKTIQERSLNLRLLCSTPLFLIFTVIVYIKYKKLHAKMTAAGIKPPENLSGIIMTILESHIHSEHFTLNEDEVREIIEKLKQLSLAGLERGSVVFTKRDVEKVGLDVKKVKDLVISVPSPTNDGVFCQKVLDEDYSLFFCHQAIQESLAALAVADKSYEDFKELTEEKLHEPHYIVVRQILSGVLFNKETSQLAAKQSEVLNKSKKQKYFLKTLRNELEDKVNSPMDMLNLLITLRECGDHKDIVKMIRTNLPKITLSGIPLTPSDLHAAAVVARNCKHLSIMQLINCQLDSYGLRVLAEGMKNSSVEITVFDVSFNANLGSESMADLYEICRRGQGLNYWQCGFRQKDILTFNPKTAHRTEQRIQCTEDVAIEEEFNNHKVLNCAKYNVQTYPDLLKRLASSEKKTVKISLSDYEAENDLEDLCEIIQSCKQIEELAVSQSELTEAQLKSISTEVATRELEALNVFLNHGIEEKGWSVLGKIAKTSRIKQLFLTASFLTEEKLRNFKRSIAGAEINKLDVSRNDDMDEHTMEVVGEIVEECKVQELVMGYCELNPDNVKRFKSVVERAKIKRIDLSGNDKLGVEGFSALGEIVLRCEVKLLDISECDPSPDEVRSFREAAYDSKITKLNVSRNRHMGESGLEDIGKMVGQCQIQELLIRQCELEANTLRSFKRGLDEAKIPILGLGYYFMKVRKTTDEEVEILADLLKNVTDQLTINDWDISEKNRRYLQRTLNELPQQGVKVMLNRGKNIVLTQEVSDEVNPKA